MMDFPVGVVETHLLKSVDRAPILDLSKVRRNSVAIAVAPVVPEQYIVRCYVVCYC